MTTLVITVDFEQLYRRNGLAQSLNGRYTVHTEGYLMMYIPLKLITIGKIYPFEASPFETSFNLQRYS